MLVSKKNLFLGFSFLLLITKSHAQLLIVSEANNKVLASKLVGGGITISNVKLNASPVATGIFYDNNHLSKIGIDSGIVLTTGVAKSNFPTLKGLDGDGVTRAVNMLLVNGNNWPGDPDISALVKNRPTFDACILEFDFVPSEDSAQFRYVFSSEEYPQFTCLSPPDDYYDAFGFFISGPGYTSPQNIAVVPGTNVPITTHTINDQACGLYPQYYIPNYDNVYCTHNGHTTVLVAKAYVQAGKTYHIKMAIADVADDGYDSAVFLEAHSFHSGDLRIENLCPLDNGIPYVAEGCNKGTIKIRRSTADPLPAHVGVSISGTASNGKDVQSISTNVVIPADSLSVTIPIVPLVDHIPEGTENLKIKIYNAGQPGASYVDSTQIEIRDYDLLKITPQDSIGVCKNKSVQLSAESGYATYSWASDGTLNDRTIANPVASPAGNKTTYVCTANKAACYARDSIILKIKDIELISVQDVRCKDETDGSINVSAGWEWTQPVGYDINGLSNRTDSSFKNLTKGLYNIKIKDNTGCIDSITASVNQAFPDLTLSDSIVNASCVGQNGSVIITANGGLSPYTFSPDSNVFQGNNTLSVAGGNQTISVKDANACITSKNIFVPRDSIITLSVATSPASCNGNADGRVSITANGGSDVYEYSSDGINFQAAASFNLAYGTYKIAVRDNKGCRADSTIILPANNNIQLNVLSLNDTICEGDSYTLQTISDALNFKWTPSSSLSADNILSPIATPDLTTTYYVHATTGVCEREDSVTITVRPAPIPNAGNDKTICYGGRVQLSAEGGVSFKWQPVSQLSDAFASNPIAAPKENTRFFLTVADRFGCKSLKTDTVLVKVTTPVKVYAGNDTIASVNQPVQLFGTSNANHFEWTPSLGLNDPFIFNPVATLTQDQQYILRSYTDDWCTGFDTIRIKVYKGPDIYVASAFTPNADGLNDILHPTAVGLKQPGLFRIFNRFGQLIFETKDWKKGWDGMFRGKQADMATYVWYADGEDYQGKRVFRKGIVVLIR